MKIYYNDDCLIPIIQICRERIICDVMETVYSYCKTDTKKTKRTKKIYKRCLREINSMAFMYNLCRKTFSSYNNGFVKFWNNRICLKINKQLLIYI